MIVSIISVMKNFLPWKSSFIILEIKKNNVVCNILVTFVALKILLAAGIFLRAVLKFVFVLALVLALFS